MLLSEFIPQAESQNGGFAFVRTTNGVPLYGIELFGSTSGAILSNVSASGLAPGITFDPKLPSLVSTKMLPFMNFCPHGLTCAGPAQPTGLSREITSHGKMIGPLVHHPLPEHFSY